MRCLLLFLCSSLLLFRATQAYIELGTNVDNCPFQSQVKNTKWTWQNARGPNTIWTQPLWTSLLNAAGLGHLSKLPGTWEGSGLNLIALPGADPDPPNNGTRAFRLKLSTFQERLVFNPILRDVPNRGSLLNLTSTVGQMDQFLQGLQYNQVINETCTTENSRLSPSICYCDGLPHEIHRENGIFQSIPPSEFPFIPHTTLSRQGTIPHGQAFLLQTNNSEEPNNVLQQPVQETPGPAVIPDESSLPFPIPGFTPPANPALFLPTSPYLSAYVTPSFLPPGITAEIVLNPNVLLRQQTANQTILKTVAFTVATGTCEDCQVLNLPAVKFNARAASVTSTFWVQQVERIDGVVFLQLQYSQNVMLDFLGIRWPHITVATLVKQTNTYERWWW
jgi:hypothetical protein